MQVKTFNEEEAKKELKSCPKIVQDYFKLINKHWERQKGLTNDALSKLKEVSKELLLAKERIKDVKN